MMNRRFGVMLERGIRDLALERDVIAVHFESEIIENRVIRKQKKLVPYFADYILTGLCLLVEGRGARRRYNSGGKKKSEQNKTEPCPVLQHESLLKQNLVVVLLFRLRTLWKGLQEAVLQRVLA